MKEAKLIEWGKVIDDIDFSKKTMFEVADEVILMGFQSWGQTSEERKKFWDKLFTWLGVGNDEAVRTKIYTDKFSKCFPLGKFEDEQAAVVGVLKELLIQKKRK
jgi:multimeric flavodoxin WrbA